jgi:hypothetical protein
MKSYGGRPVVDALVNGQGPFLFILDTAASGGRIGTKLVEALGLEPVGEARVRSGTGEPVPAKLYRLDTVEMNGLILRDIDAIALNPGEPDRPSVLPLKAFAEFLLTLDFPGHRIIAAPGALPPSDGKTVLDYSGVLVSVPVTIGGIPLKMHPDTGSPGGFTVPFELADKLTLAEPPHAVGKGMTVNATFTISAAPLKGKIAWGALEVENPVLEFIPGLREPLVGCTILVQYAITIDQKNSRVRFAGPGAR